MGEAKRRKLLDPTWGKADPGSYKEAEQAREYARLIAQVKRDVPDLPEKLSAACLEEMQQLTDFQQDQLMKLYEDFVAGGHSRKCQEDWGQWLEDFLKAAKPTVDPAVFELFVGQVLFMSTFSDHP